MTLVFDAAPFVKHEPLTVWLQGRDEAANCYVECRVTQQALRVHCGAVGGITDKELLRAFEVCRERIEKAANRKYEAGRVEHLPDRTVVWLKVADL